jgi:predicted O-methyltransferase YrrM
MGSRRKNPNRTVRNEFEKSRKQIEMIRQQWLRLKPQLRKIRHFLRRTGPPQPLRDLAKIAALSLPRNEAFFSAKAAADQVQGMFSDFSMAIVDSVLSFQAATGMVGNILEFGVYRGRSAALIGRHLAERERLVLVDVADYLDPRAIAPFGKSAEFILGATQDFKKQFSGYNGQRHRFRFIHIDASHAYRATFTELAMADELLADRGVIALDDFTNLNYSQNIAAIYRYLYTSGTDLMPFLVTDEKAYLCRKKILPLYSAFVLDRLIAEIRSRGIADFCLARTDNDPDYQAFYARQRLENEEGHFYGADIYKNYFQL